MSTAPIDPRPDEPTTDANGVATYNGRQFFGSQGMSTGADRAELTYLRDLCAWQERAGDVARYRWILANPEDARHLLHLLQQGKGDAKAFTKMIDRIMASEAAATAARSEAHARRAT